MEEIILASRSPRRQELLGLVCPVFACVPADIDESAVKADTPEDSVQKLAAAKAAPLSKSHPQAVIIGADTIVCLHQRILGKPRNETEAVEYLRALSGREHRVLTGVCLRQGKKETCFFEETFVRFYSLTEEEIISYVNTGEPMDKAGAYGIQGKGALLVESIRGDYFNVVGLPVGKLKRELDRFRLKLEKNS